MNISQAEHGGNGESNGVVNQSLKWPTPGIYGGKPRQLLHKIIINFRNSGRALNSFDCAGLQSVWCDRWVRDRIMWETITAFFGVMSAGIFIAHAVDGYRSRFY